MAMVGHFKVAALILLVPMSYASAYFQPISYTIALTENDESNMVITRRLLLAINNTYVGSIRYEIRPHSSQPSFIQSLHIEQAFRTSKGYGKVLLYHALKDILQEGSTSVELVRCAFDLSPSEDAHLRDEQLKGWYRKFGFQEQGDRVMRLNPRKLLSAEVVPNFTEKDITFDFRKPLLLQLKKKSA
jgi:hypothetical protein